MWGRCVQKWSQRSSLKNKSKEEFLATKQIIVLEYPAYSLDLAPCDFFLFPKIKEILKGRHFDDIRSNTMAALKALPQNQFQNCFEGWTRHWHPSTASQGEYFEGDHGGIQHWGIEHFYGDEFANFIVRLHMSKMEYLNGISYKLKVHWVIV